MSGYVAWLDTLEGAGPARIGGKGAGLARLGSAGFPVPPGFALTVDAYNEFHRANRLDTEMASLAALPQRPSLTAVRDACGSILGLAHAADLPGAIEEEVRAAFEALAARTGRQATFAVRSSAASEDSAGASCAGLYESYINLATCEEVLASIVRCYRSLWEPRAVQYRAVKGIDHGREAMGIVVMQTVPSAVSGVAFTLNPVTGATDEVLVNSAWGLGESIVSGLVTPDNFVVGKDGAIRQRDIFNKVVRIDAVPGGTEKRMNAPGMATAPSLDDARLAQVLDASLAVERLYGLPMDIEFAYDAAGRFYLLQARPVTT